MEMTANYKSIDMGKWPRREYYEHYATGTKCMISITATVDVTNLYNICKEKNKDFFVCMLYTLTSTINNHDEFLTGYCRENGRLMIWDKIVPAFAVFHKETETFTKTWTKWISDFPQFYEECTNSIEKAEKAKGFSVPDLPDNTFDVTYIRDLVFTSVEMKLSESGKYLSPIITMGKPLDKGSHVLIPLAFEISHAVADSFHITRFFKETEKLTDEITKLI